MPTCVSATKRDGLCYSTHCTRRAYIQLDLTKDLSENSHRRISGKDLKVYKNYMFTKTTASINISKHNKIKSAVFSRDYAEACNGRPSLHPANQTKSPRSGEHVINYYASLLVNIYCIKKTRSWTFFDWMEPVTCKHKQTFNCKMQELAACFG